MSRFFSPPFVVSVFLLTGAAIVAWPVAKWLGVRGIKEPLPLEQDLGALDSDTLWPYILPDPQRDRHVLPGTVIDALGTEEYLSWTLTDSSLPPQDPTHLVHVDVTYYTGGHNLVPHTPDVCRVGSGYQLEGAENIDLQISGVPGGTVPVRLCIFRKTKIFNAEELPVVYTFFCNGDFVATRNDVRIRVNDPRNVYAFFSKVEISFDGANREQTLEGTKKLFGVLLPELLKDHWPDFAQAEKEARNSEAK